MAKIYEVDGLGKWNIETEKFVQVINISDEVIIIDVPEDDDKLEALKNVLEFEGYSTTTLMSDSNKLEIIINQNKDFLINMFILTSLDIEIPDTAMERFENIKNKLSGFSNTAKLNLLSM